MATETFPMRLIAIRDLTSKVKHLVFQREGEGVFTYIPGQFISIHFEQDGKLLRRSYSLAMLNPPANQIEFAFSYVQGGPASELLWHLKVGDVLQASGPYGRLILREEPVKRCYLMATGTGVTPYRAMLPQLLTALSADPNRHYHIALGVQHRADQLYTEDFCHYANQHPHLDFRLYYSREPKDGLASYERSGYVQTIFDEVIPCPDHDIIYLCGNPNMIDQSYEMLKTLGFPAQQVRREKYVS